MDGTGAVWTGNAVADIGVSAISVDRNVPGYQQPRLDRFAQSRLNGLIGGYGSDGTDIGVGRLDKTEDEKNQGCSAAAN